ncbi:MAG: hypothetical protein Q8922_03305 [Bacteroidota bacterium]|nr:hypothetical protein [Bacteroidota bacterium]MDP4232993.1 hypothetical protein [Bacteroidota bacterium]MDP4242037.1 hypothetical protein [Bacteroidota bacterium]MDP4286940.1 hypothetical protein [Bacteroidota bacterium]
MSRFVSNNLFEFWMAYCGLILVAFYVPFLRSYIATPIVCGTLLFGAWRMATIVRDSIRKASAASGRYLRPLDYFDKVESKRAHVTTGIWLGSSLVYIWAENPFWLIAVLKIYSILWVPFMSFIIGYGLATKISAGKDNPGVQ